MKSSFTSQVWYRSSQLLLGAVLLLMIGYLLIYTVYAIGLMRFPFDYDQGEGFELQDTILFSRGEWPYRNNEVYPFYASNYPPLFHVILVPFVWFFGPAYWYGRLVAFIGTLITAYAIGYAVYRESRHREIALLSGLAFLASNYVYHVGPLFRQHMFMVMFETLSVVVLAQVAEQGWPRRKLIAGLALLLAAGYTKPLALATSVAVFGFLFIRNPRRCVLWGIGFAAVAGLIFLWINTSTNGAWWDNIIAANVNTYLPHQFVGLFKQWFRLHAVLIIMAGILAAYELYFARLSLYSVWWVFAVLNTILSGKWGAGDSYFATAIAATCILAGIFAGRMLQGEWTFGDNPMTRRLVGLRQPLSTAARFVIPALYLIYGLSVLHLPTEGAVFGSLAETLGLESSYGDRYAFYDSAGWVEGYATIGHLPTQQDTDNGWRIVDVLRQSDLPAMSEEAAFSLHADKDVVTNPTQLKNLYENHMFDPTNLVAAIQQHDFSVVIFRAQFYPPPVLEAVYEAYYPADMIPMNGFNYEIWRPGPPQDERRAFLTHLSTSDPVTQIFSLPFEQAQRWLPHALKHQNWETQSEPQPNDEGCVTETYQKSGLVLSARLCPVAAGAELTLEMDAP